MVAALAPRILRPYAALLHTVIHGKMESPWNIIEFTGRCEFGVAISIVPDVMVGKDAQQGGLAASARAHDHEELALLYLERHPADGDQLAESLVQVADAYCRPRGERLRGFYLGERTGHDAAVPICRATARFTTP
jgi:hypothetical protein